MQRWGQLFIKQPPRALSKFNQRAKQLPSPKNEQPFTLISAAMPWLALTTTDQLEQITATSSQRPQVLFKHSTRCSVSSMAKNRMEGGLAQLSEKADVYYLDLLSFREVSNKIAELFSVQHESPQVLVIVNGNCVLELSHLEITPGEVTQALQLAALK